MTPVSFSRETFAKLSPHPYALASLRGDSGTSQQSPNGSSTRANGRLPEQPRCFQINHGSLSHAHGSAVVRSGDTTVICGVRGEILPVSSIPNYRPRSRHELELRRKESNQNMEEPFGAGENDEDELRDYDLLVPNIELATGCAPQFLPGAPPSSMAQTLSTRVFSLLHQCRLVNAEELRVWYRRPKFGSQDQDSMDDAEDNQTNGEEDEEELKAYWVLYIDVLFISYDGNPFDAAWAAIVAALRDTKLPAAHWDADREIVVCASRTDTRPLNPNGLPIATTAAVLLEKREQQRGKQTGVSGSTWFLVDPDRLEESLCEETLSMVVDGKGADGEIVIRNMTKSGGAAITPNLLRHFTEIASERWNGARLAMP